MLVLSACKAGEVPTYAFQEASGTQLPSTSDFTVSYAILGTNSAVVASQQITVDVMALTFAPLSPAAEILGINRATLFRKLRRLSMES